MSASTLWITRDEFNRGGNDDYRKCAINRTIAAGVAFTSEVNTFEDLLKLVLAPRCPKCREFLKLELGGGNLSTYTMSGHCKDCGLKVRFTLPINCVEVSYDE